MDFVFAALVEAATDGWFTPREAFAEARGIVAYQRQRGYVAIVTHKLRNDVSVLEGSGGNVAVLRAQTARC